MNLEALQREMAAAVMLPLTADEQMRARTPDGHSTSAIAESFIAPNSRLSAFERLEIYNRQYWFRVLGALAEDFAGLGVVIGARAFEKLSIAYLAAHPSRSFTLRNLGSRLPEWLAANPQFAGRRHRLALDVARIEWAFVEAFDGAEHNPLTLDQVATLDAGSRLALQPHLRLAALEYPADDLVLGLHNREKRQTSEAGVRHEGSPDAPAKLPKLRRRPTWLAAHRVDNSVFYRRLKREEFLTLTAIRHGLPLAEALADGFADSRIPEPRRALCVREWFATWAELGWICAPDFETLL
ncbi:MAG: DNA-binding domain-containing protein [Terracidiphilus sp.]